MIYPVSFNAVTAKCFHTDASCKIEESSYYLTDASCYDNQVVMAIKVNIAKELEEV